MTDSSYRIVVLGAGGVGKSALTLRLISDEFATEYDPTIEDSYRKQVTIDGKPALLDVLDTAGQEEYASLQDQWIREGDGYLIVYAINSASTFEEAQVLHDKIHRIKDDDKFAMVLAGNKCDLDSERQVTKKKAEEQSALWGCPFFETSAKTKQNTEESFHQVVREIRQLKQPAQVAPKKKGLCQIL